MGQFIDLTAKDGFTFPAYVAEPAGKPRGAIVVCTYHPSAILRADDERKTVLLKALRDDLARAGATARDPK